ncbi:hypothetical protein HT031_004153 [Scenedesmus sp. PABB004]|nr:hypothetical protein HT031_004153 [Scenedesmus sp. PABB004]
MLQGARSGMNLLMRARAASAWPGSGSAAVSASSPCRPRRRCCSAALPPSVVDKAHEGKSLRDIIKLPPGALQGLKEGKADDMLAAFNIKTIEDLGAWKFFRAARAIATLAAREDAAKRPPAGAASNFNGIVDKAWESASLTELLAAPPSALQGLAPWTDGALKELGIKTVGDLAAWRFAAWADAMTTLAAWERDDFGSR